MGCREKTFQHTARMHGAEFRVSTMGEEWAAGSWAYMCTADLEHEVSMALIWASWLVLWGTAGLADESCTLYPFFVWIFSIRRADNLYLLHKLLQVARLDGLSAGGKVSGEVTLCKSAPLSFHPQLRPGVQRSGLLARQQYGVLGTIRTLLALGLLSISQFGFW